MEYGYQITTEDDGIVVYLEVDGVITTRQPHHPEAELIDGKGSWKNEAEAVAWAEAQIEILVNPPASNPTPLAPAEQPEAEAIESEATN